MKQGDPQFWHRSRRRDSLVWEPIARWTATKLFIAGKAVWLAHSIDIDATGQDHDRRRGPNGRNLCYWCRAEVPKGRRNWCGDECVADYKLHHDWQTIRRAVFKRDRGVCCLCGCDTEKVRRVFRPLYRNDWRTIVSLLKELGWPKETSRDWWEADHIEAKSRGGEDHPRNLRTLCVPCHKARTRKQHGDWAREARTGTDWPL